MSRAVQTTPPVLDSAGGGFIDYLSITKMAGDLYPWDDQMEGEYIRRALQWVGVPWNVTEWFMSAGWTVEKGLHGYRKRFVLWEGGCTVQIGHLSGRIQVVFSGRGCRALDEYSSLIKGTAWASILAQGEQIKVTRIDLARDFLTDVTPLDLVEHIQPGRGRTSGYIHSPTGETMTYGSRQSEKYLRVYRYTDPHPRSKTLRFEWELKGDKAAQAFRFLCEGQTVDGLLAGLALDFGVRSGLWQENTMIGEAVRLKHEPKERAGRTRWIYKVCIPAMRTALWEGTVTREDLVKALGLDSMEDEA